MQRLNDVVTEWADGLYPQTSEISRQRVCAEVLKIIKENETALRTALLTDERIAMTTLQLLRGLNLPERDAGSIYCPLSQRVRQLFRVRLGAFLNGPIPDLFPEEASEQEEA